MMMAAYTKNSLISDIELFLLFTLLLAPILNGARDYESLINFNHRPINLSKLY